MKWDSPQNALISMKFSRSHVRNMQQLMDIHAVNGYSCNDWWVLYLIDDVIIAESAIISNFNRTDCQFRYIAPHWSQIPFNGKWRMILNYSRFDHEVMHTVASRKFSGVVGEMNLYQRKILNVWEFWISKYAWFHLIYHYRERKNLMISF